MEITTCFRELVQKDSLSMELSEGKLQLHWAETSEYSQYDTTDSRKLVTGFLTPTEAEKYASMFRNKKRQYEMLSTRIHAKNLIRSYLKDNYGLNLIHLIDICIENKPVGIRQGMPFVKIHGINLESLKISLTHNDSTIGTIIGEGCLVGIDSEKIIDASSSFLELFMSKKEITWMNSNFPKLSSKQKSTLLWCSKEAIGKALGTGFSLGFSSISIQSSNGTNHVALKLDDRMHKYIPYVNPICSLYYDFNTDSCKVMCVIYDSH